MSQYDHHGHCSNCFKTTCALGCQMVECPRRCGHPFHECKGDEHALICPRMLVTCLNASYGCQTKIIRQNVAKHLEICPASVICCSMTWSRKRLVKPRPWTLEPNTLVPKDGEPIGLDLRLLSNDTWIIRDNVTRSKETHPPLSLSVVAVDVVPNLPRLESFVCNELIRRDEYASHILDTHCTIMADLEWLEHRCPLASSGCTFFKRRFHPLVEGNKVVFNHKRYCFSVHSKRDTDHPINPTDEDQVTLMDLPEEVLNYLLGFLDSCALKDFALVNKQMSEFVKQKKVHRGIVLANWKKLIDQDDQFTWHIASFDYKFSNGFSQVKKWGLEEPSGMANHLKECPFYDRNDLGENEKLYAPDGKPNILPDLMAKLELTGKMPQTDRMAQIRNMAQICNVAQTNYGVNYSDAFARIFQEEFQDDLKMNCEECEK